MIYSDHKCKICGKKRGNHKAITLNCPMGRKSRIGYIMFSDKDVFVPSDKEPKPPKFVL